MIFTAIGGIVAGSLFGLTAGTSAFALVSGLVGGGLAFGAKYLLNSYINRKKRRSYSAVAGESQIGGAVPVSTLYGKGKTPGHRLGYFKFGEGNKYNAEVFRLAHGWCDGLEPYVYFYGEKHDLVERAKIGNEVAHYGVDGFGDLISIRFYDGRPGQQADAKLVADTAGLGQTWKATSRCANMTYVVFERLWDPEKFTKGRPSVEWVLRGLRGYDPRKDSTVAGGAGAQRLNDPSTYVFTENPAVHRLNYQLGLRGPLSNRALIGEGKSLGQLDLSSYFVAMNVADTVREGKPTYACGLWATSDDDHTEILKEFDDAMAGYAMNRRGLSGIVVGAPQVPVLTLTDADIDAGRRRQLQHRKSSFDVFNHLSGQFTSIDKNWEAESLKPIVVNADVAADGRARGTANDFLQVSDPDIAQYLLQIRYRQNRKSGSATVPVSRRVGFAVEEGEWINWRGKTWLVKNWSADRQLRVTLTLAETGGDVYSSDGIEPGPIVIPSPPQVNPSLLSTVQNFAVEVGMIAGANGDEVPALRFTWTPPADPTISAVRFEYFIGDDPTGQAIYRDQTADAEAGVYVTSKDVQAGVYYTARATITTVPDRFKTWTPWKTTAATTPPRSIYLPGMLDEVMEHVDEHMAPLRATNLRQIYEDTRSNALAAMKQDAGQYVDVQRDLVHIRSTFGSVTADYQSLIEAKTGPGSASAQRIDKVEASIAGFASATALDATTARVTNVEGATTAISNRLILVEAELPNKVSASVLTDYATKVYADDKSSSAAASYTAALKVQLEGPTGSITAAQGAAQAASDLAGGKGKVIYGSSAPATADRQSQNLWIDTSGGANTPKRWNGSAWAAVTDKVATDAAAAAADALGQVATKASVTALNQLTGRVDDQDGLISAQGNLISGVQSDVGKVSASGLMRAKTVATESGASSTVGLYAAATAGEGTTREAAILMSAIAGNKSMIGLVADLVYFTDSTGNKAYPFVFSGGVARLENVVVGTLKFNQLSSNNGKLVLRGSGSLADLSVYV